MRAAIRTSRSARTIGWLLLGFAPALAAPAFAQAETDPKVATVKSLDGIGPVGEWRKLPGTYVLSEGPAGLPDGTVFFTDYRGGGIFRIDPATGEITKFIDNINAGAIAIDANGKLVVAETRQGKILRIDPATRAITTISAGYGGVRFNAPNDLVLDAHGGLYLTDPSNGATLPLAQGKQSVYYVDATGKTTRVVDYLPRPNGIALSRDGSMLLVGLTSESELLGYHIRRPGVLDPDSVVFGRMEFTPPVKRGEGARTGIDGMTIDARGNVYASSRFGIQVFDPQGHTLGTIATPEIPSNLKFAGKDGHTLYVTTYSSIFAVPMAAEGAPRR